MPKGFVRLTEFGRDHGLIHDMVVTGRKAGAGSDFYAKLARDPRLFRKVVNLVCGTPSEIALHEAVEKGVTKRQRYYRFFDPGVSLVELRDVPIVRERHLIDTSRNDYFPLADQRDLRYLIRFSDYHDGSYDGYDNEEWARQGCEPQERFLRIPMETSFDKTIKQQVSLLARNEEMASARTVVMLLVIHELATGKKLLVDQFVNCSETSRKGRHWKVGTTDGKMTGGIIIQDWEDKRSAQFGAAAMKKL